MGTLPTEIFISRLCELIPKLEGDDCYIEKIESGIRISFYDGQIFDIFEVGGWVQVGSIIVSVQQMDSFDYIEEVKDFVLGLNSRCLGCRFALEPDGSLLLVEDIPIENVTDLKLNQAIDAISYVDYVFFDLICETGRVGLAPTEDEVDTRVNEKEDSFEKYH